MQILQQCLTLPVHQGLEGEEWGKGSFGTAQHGTARHGTARHGTARHSTAQHTAQPSAAKLGHARISNQPCHPTAYIIVDSSIGSHNKTADSKLTHESQALSSSVCLTDLLSQVCIVLRQLLHEIICRGYVLQWSRHQALYSDITQLQIQTSLPVNIRNGTSQARS